MSQNIENNENMCNELFEHFEGIVNGLSGLKHKLLHFNNY
jgi:hypothetical protein